MGKIILSRKGQTVTDVIIVVLILTAFAIGVIFANKILTEVNSEVQADSDIHSVAKASLSNVSDHYASTFDSAFIIMLVLFWILLIVTSVFIDTNPIFFIVVCLLLVFVFVIGMIASNTYTEILTDSGELTTFSSSFPMTNFVMSNLLLFVMAMGFSSAIALYAKSGGGGI